MGKQYSWVSFCAFSSGSTFEGWSNQDSGHSRPSFSFRFSAKFDFYRLHRPWIRILRCTGTFHYFLNSFHDHNVVNFKLRQVITTMEVPQSEIPCKPKNAYEVLVKRAPRTRPFCAESLPESQGTVRIMRPICIINFYINSFFSKYLARILTSCFHFWGNVRFLTTLLFRQGKKKSTKVALWRFCVTLLYK